MFFNKLFCPFCGILAASVTVVHSARLAYRVSSDSHFKGILHNICLIDYPTNRLVATSIMPLAYILLSLHTSSVMSERHRELAVSTLNLSLIRFSSMYCSSVGFGYFLRPVRPLLAAIPFSCRIRAILFSLMISSRRSNSFLKQLMTAFSSPISHFPFSSEHDNRCFVTPLEPRTMPVSYSVSSFLANLIPSPGFLQSMPLLFLESRSPFLSVHFL